MGGTNPPPCVNGLGKALRSIIKICYHYQITKLFGTIMRHYYLDFEKCNDYIDSTVKNNDSSHMVRPLVLCLQTVFEPKTVQIIYLKERSRFVPVVIRP